MCPVRVQWKSSSGETFLEFITPACLAEILDVGMRGTFLVIDRDIYGARDQRQLNRARSYEMEVAQQA